MAGESGIKKTADFLSGMAGRVIMIAIMILVIFVAVRFSFRFGHSIFYQSPAEAAPGRDVEVTIEKGASIDELAEQLYEDGIITNELAFRTGIAKENELMEAVEGIRDFAAASVIRVL